MFEIVFLFIGVLPICIATQQCLDKSYSLFGTKTHYSEVRATLGGQHQGGCEPIGVYMVIRHGARYPDDSALPIQKQVEAFATKLNQTGRAKLCRTDLEALRKWRAWSTNYDDKNLTRYGVKEMRELARRFRRTLMEDTSRKNENVTFFEILSFFATDKQRNIESREAFKEQLFDREGKDGDRVLSPSVYGTIPKKRDPLEPSKSCPRYIREVKKNPNISKEYDKFVKGSATAVHCTPGSYASADCNMNSQEMAFEAWAPGRCRSFISLVRKRVTKRLGVKRNVINNKFVMKLYRTCYDETFARRFNTKQRSPWCNIFNEKDLKILEYASDLEDYPEKSDLFPITREQNCFLAKDIIHFLTQSRNDDYRGLQHPRKPFFGRFRFVSSRIVVSLGATFGLYRTTTPLTAEGFSTQKFRAFRMSQLAPSAANIAFVLYRCVKKNNPRDVYKLRIFWNEKLLTDIPACPRAEGRNGRLCGLKQWINYYPQYIPGSPNECDQKEICS